MQTIFSSMPTVKSEMHYAQNSSANLDVAISTERLNLNGVSKADARELLEKLYSSPIVTEKYATGEVKDMEWVDKRVSIWTSRLASGDPFSCYVVRTKQGELVGLVILGHGDNPGQSELAYIFNNSFWNKGYGTEAVGAVVNQLAPYLKALGHEIDGEKFKEILATARPDNPGSFRILEKLGFSFNKTEERHDAPRLFYSHNVEKSPDLPTGLPWTQGLATPGGLSVKQIAFK